MIGNQVLLILVDSGSSSSFINQAMLSRIKCDIQKTEPLAVQQYLVDWIDTCNLTYNGLLVGSMRANK